MTFTELFNTRHTSGVHNGKDGSASLGAYEIPSLQSTGYTEANLYRDLQTNSVPDVRKNRRDISDIVSQMSNINKKYFNKSFLDCNKPIELPNDMNHINRK